MNDVVVSAAVTGIISLLGVVVSHYVTAKQVETQLHVTQEVMKNELVRIKEDVKEHNHYARMFAESMPVVKEQIKVINNRLEDLEKQ